MKNMASNVVVDTNALVSSLSSKSEFHKLIRLILDEDVSMFVTDEIMFEYEEVLHQKYSETVAQNFLSALKEIPTVEYVNIYFKWNLLTQDEDDNKFVDCYLAANAEYLITNDTGYNALKKIDFPKVNLIKLEEFLTQY
jgi:putative PIN family toxin of toxin-antitoxin system